MGNYVERADRIETRILTFIAVKCLRGEGVEESDPVRSVVRLYTLSGLFVTEYESADLAEGE